MLQYYYIVIITINIKKTNFDFIRAIRTHFTQLQHEEFRVL